MVTLNTLDPPPACSHVWLSLHDPQLKPLLVRQSDYVPGTEETEQHSGNGVRTVIVEDASRFARQLMAQELGITLLISRGVQLLTASGDDLTASDDPTRKMMRHARERVRKEKGKCEGR